MVPGKNAGNKKEIICYIPGLFPLKGRYLRKREFNSYLYNKGCNLFIYQSRTVCHIWFRLMYRSNVLKYFICKVILEGRIHGKSVFWLYHGQTSKKFPVKQNKYNWIHLTLKYLRLHVELLYEYFDHKFEKSNQCFDSTQ